MNIKQNFFLRDRSHKELILTKDGEQFDRHVVTILNELEIARKEISRNQEQMIRLGLPLLLVSSISHKLLQV